MGLFKKFPTKWQFFGSLCICGFYILWVCRSQVSYHQPQHFYFADLNSERIFRDKSVTVHMGAVTYGEVYVNKTLHIIQTTLLLTEANLQWYVFTTDDSADIILNSTKEWPDYLKTRLTVIKPALHCLKWMNHVGSFHLGGIHIKQCVFSGIENMNLTKYTDKMIFVDLDIFVVDNIVLLWNHFHIFDDQHVMAMSRADLRYIKLKYSHYMYDRVYGANSGVILIHLGHLSGFNFEEKYIQYAKERKYYQNGETENIKMNDDQNVLNVLFYKHPYKLLTLGCKWNYRGSMDATCSPGNTFHCDEATSQGVSLIHAYSDTFFTRSHYAAVYNCTIALHLRRVEDTIKCMRKGIEYFKLKRNRSCPLHLINLKPLEIALNKRFSVN